MGSFAKLAAFPVGYFRAVARWLLINRRDVVSHYHMLSAEIERIGFIKVHYKSVPGENGQLHKTQERVGMSVTKGSTLEKLLRAYIAQGGNPFDISPFRYPDQHKIGGINSDGSTTLRHEYPEGGVLAPSGAAPNSPADDETGTGFGQDHGGWVKSDRYYPARWGGRISRGAWDSNSVVKSMHQMRSWANQMIKERVQDMEWRIIKQCDLREQLLIERDEVIMQAFSGTLNGLPSFDPELFNKSLLVQSIIDDMQKLIFETDISGEILGYRASPVTGVLYFALKDTISEHRDPLGG